MSLRAITEAAGANVAAVSYHLAQEDGPRRDRAVDRAAAQEQIDGSAEEPTLEQIAVAWTGPVVRAVAASPCAEQVFMRAVWADARHLHGRAPRSGDAAVVGRRGRAGAALARVLPGADEAELRFRAAAVGSILNFVTTGAAGLDGKPADEIERLLLPVMSARFSAARAAPTR